MHIKEMFHTNQTNSLQNVRALSGCVTQKLDIIMQGIEDIPLLPLRRTYIVKRKQGKSYVFCSAVQGEVEG